MKKILFLLLLFSSSVYCQTINIEKLRQSYSIETRVILHGLDSLIYLDTVNNYLRPNFKENFTLEFRKIGESFKTSQKFLLYAKLVNVATEKELLDILNNQNELTVIRGYAYMAYAYKCDQEKKKEKTLNYNFKLNTLNGCEGFNNISFSEFKKDIRVRNAYAPNPTHTVLDSQEIDVRKKENEIRKEQGIPIRKDTL
jgi:hypothetical protein